MNKLNPINLFIFTSFFCYELFASPCQKAFEEKLMPAELNLTFLEKATNQNKTLFLDKLFLNRNTNSIDKEFISIFISFIQDKKPLLWNESLIFWRAENLLKKGANIDIDLGGWTSLHFLLSRDWKELDNTSILHKAIDFLIKNKTDINAITENQLTALHLAVLYNNLPTIKKLLFYDVNINARDSRGWTALYYNYSLNPEIDNILIEAGADIHNKDNENKTFKELRQQN